jgi:hypothetical protein
MEVSIDFTDYSLIQENSIQFIHSLNSGAFKPLLAQVHKQLGVVPNSPPQTRGQPPAAYFFAPKSQYEPCHLRQ